MADLGGVGSQIAGELVGIAKQTITETAKAAGSVVSATAETLSSGVAAITPTQPPPSQGGGKEGVAGAADPLAQIKARNQAREKQQLDRVNGELATYLENKKRKDQQKEEVEEQEKMQDLQKKQSDKQKRADDLIRSTQRQYGGTGESAKKQF